MSSNNLVVIGASGSIAADRLEGVVYRHIDYSDESIIEKAAEDVYEK